MNSYESGKERRSILQNWENESKDLRLFHGQLSQSTVWIFWYILNTKLKHNTVHEVVRSPINLTPRCISENGQNSEHFFCMRVDRWYAFYLSSKYCLNSSFVKKADPIQTDALSRNCVFLRHKRDSLVSQNSITTAFFLAWWSQQWTVLNWLNINE